MNFLFCLLSSLFVSMYVSAQADTLKYRIHLRDKALTSYSLDCPEAFLSKKAIQRRARQHLAIDSTDLPVCRAYVEAIRSYGVKVLVTGKWLNVVTVSCNDPMLIDSICSLPFVLSSELVWSAPEGKDWRLPVAQRRDAIQRKEAENENKELTMHQLQLCQGDKLHDAGFRGQQMTIAVIDAGFHNMDRIRAMKKINVLGVKDFVNPNSDIFAEHSHGLGVLSCMAMNSKKVMIGSAPEASYWLLRSEDDSSEQWVEQDYWAAAVEFADSVGADLINSSLGYQSFEDSTLNYKHYQLDGNFAFISRQASMVARKGMVLVCSAGNTGEGSWKKITPPADAFDVLTVGAVDATGELATFSAVGNTSDGRTKPDVVAMGNLAYVMGTSGTLRRANGTSFASPIMCGLVACLWQALPELTAKEIIEVVRESGDRSLHPDNIYGYGLPRLWDAYLHIKNK